jgi:hypothetical protein
MAHGNWLGMEDEHMVKFLARLLYCKRTGSYVVPLGRACG